MKYSGIGDLIDENMELKSRIRRMKKRHIEEKISILKMFYSVISIKKMRGMDLGKWIKDLEESLCT